MSSSPALAIGSPGAPLRSIDVIVASRSGLPPMKYKRSRDQRESEERLPFARQRRGHAAVDVDDQQARRAFVHSLGDDVTRPEYAVVLRTESPRRAAVFGFIGIDAIDAARVVAVEIPEAVLIGRKQDAIGREPFGLHDRFGGAAGDDRLVGERAVVGQRRDVQLGAVPRHVRVVPAEKADPTAVGRHARRGVEVVAAMQIGRRRR